MAIRADRVGVREDQVDIHGRVTSPSFLNELLEDLPEWTDMPVWVNGTEELLPSNNSVPVTSPILADIAYPDIRRDNQYFTYRESPTPVDGLAKIKSIKGNTLVWNQLVQNGNFADSSNWYARQSTFTVSNNVLTATPSTEGTERGVYSTAIPVKANHKYLLSCEINPPILSTARVSFGGSINYGFDVVIQANQWSKCQGIVLNDVDRNIAFYSLIRNSLTPSQTIQFRNMMVIDLTQMGLDSLTVEEFTSLFNLPYYDFNQGSLLSFNGNGIKTVGKNQYNNAIGLRNLYLNQNTSLLGNGGTTYVADLLTNKQYTLSGTRGNRSLIGFSKKQANELGNGDTIENISSVSLPYTFNSSDYHSVVYYSNTEYVATLGTDVQLEFGSVASDFEPYTSSTTSLPIYTYFPTGMKSAGSAYDELTPRKAITRIGVVDLGNLEYVYDSTVPRFYTSGLANIIRKPSTSDIKGNAISDMYEVLTANQFFASTKDKSMMIATNGNISFINTTYSSASAFKSAMSGVYLYYELATPVELPTMSFE